MNQTSFVLTNLAANPEYFEEIIQLIEKEFHYDENQHYEKDFALLMDPLNFENCFFYIDQNTNRVAAHLAVCIREAIKKEQLMKIGLIGGIVTRKEYQGQNLFRTLMLHALKSTEDIGLYMLWSEITGLYEKFNFHLSGGLIESGSSHVTHELRPAGFNRTKFSDLNNHEFERIQYLYSTFNERYFLTLKRSEREWSIIKNMDSIDLYIRKNEEGDISQYFCVGKGRDLQNVIHEIGCLPEQYIALTKTLASFKMWLPESEHELTSSKDIYFTAFMKLGSPEALNSFLHEITEQKLQILKIHDDKVLFRFDNSDHQCSEKDFIQFIFGPKPLEEFQEFNLSFYIAGTDSI